MCDKDNTSPSKSELESVSVAVVVAHLFPIRAILADALGKPLEEWEDIAIPTGSISLVEYGAEGVSEVLETGLKPEFEEAE